MSWGELADAMHCFAVVKYMDENTPWACYIYAVNPVNMDDIACIIDDGCRVEICEWSLTELLLRLNTSVDRDFRRIYVPTLLKNLKKQGKET